MSGEYQLRKDIDEIQRRIDNIKSELIANGVITEDTSVEEFNSILGTIISTVSDLEDVDGKLDGLETVIGDSTTGLIKQVNDIDDTVGDNDSGLVKTVNGHTTSIGGLNTTVSGHTSSISSLNGSIIEQNTTISHISRNLDKYHLPSVSMDWTYVFGSSINMDDVYDLEDVDGIPRLEYAYKVENGQWYERHSDSSFITTQGSPSNPIGVCNELPSQTVSVSSLSFYTYEVSTMNYYAYSSNNWVEQTDLSDFFTKTNVYNNIDSDFTTQTDFDVLDGQINDTNGIADTVTGLDGQINDTDGIADTVIEHTSSIGSVDVEITGDLQTQVLKLIRSLSDLVSFVNFVDSFNECSIGTFTYNGVTYHQVSAEYPYDYIYNTNTSKYYQKKLFGDTYGWDEYQDPLYAKFNSTHLYEVLIQYFSQSGHTHTKSNITDFAHQHTSFDLTDSPYQLVQIIPTIRVLIKVYSNGWNVYITYENTENQQMEMGLNTSYAFPILVEEPYRPANRYVYSNITHQGNMGVYGAVNSDGTIYIINRSTATSFGVFGSISYPLKAKMISATGNYSHIDINQSTDFERLTPSTATTSSAINSATLFSQLTDGTNPVLKENVDIIFKKDGTTIDTVTTDENGVAQYTYTATGTGVHTFSATDGTITSSDYTVTDWLLYDNAIIDDYNENIYYNYNNRNSVSRDANGTTLTAITNSNGIYVLAPNGNTSTTLSTYNYFDSFTLEFDFVNRQGTSSSTVVTLYLADSSARSVAFNTLGINDAGHCKITYDGSSLKVWMDGTQTYNQSIASGTKRVGFATGTSGQGGYLKFKNLRIY